MLSLVLTSCAVKHVAVPLRCIRPITITNFTKPCNPISPTKAICNGVIIEYECITPVKGDPK